MIRARQRFVLSLLMSLAILAVDASAQRLTDRRDRLLALEGLGQAVGGLLHRLFRVGGPFNCPEQSGSKGARSSTHLGGRVAAGRRVVELDEATISR